MLTHEFEVQIGTARFVDVTREVRSFARQAEGDGLLHVFLPHATAGVALFELGAGSERDVEETIDRLLPRDDRWRHQHGSTGHGADHVLPVFVSPSLVLPVVAGEVRLGTWQSVVLVDPNRDNPRRRVLLSFVRDQA